MARSVRAIPPFCHPARNGGKQRRSAQRIVGLNMQAAETRETDGSAAGHYVTGQLPGHVDAERAAGQQKLHTLRGNGYRPSSKCLPRSRATDAAHQAKQAANTSRRSETFRERFPISIWKKLGGNYALYHKSVWVPSTLLLNPDLHVLDMLLWIILRLHQKNGKPSPTQRSLARDYVLSRHSIQDALLRLEAARWSRQKRTGTRFVVWRAVVCQQTLDDRTVWVEIPGNLLRDRRLTHQAKVLYGRLQCVPGFRESSGTFSYSQLCSLTGVPRRTLHRAVNLLVNTRWLTTRQMSPYKPIQFTLRDPLAEKMEREVEKVAFRVERAENKGEQILAEMCKVLVVRNNLQQNARPEFLTNVYTDKQLELDLFYPDKVALEFNGPQHYGPTSIYDDEEEIKKQKARDAIKKAVCEEEGIHLIIVHAEDLTFDRIRELIGDRLPLRKDLDIYQPIIDYLEFRSRKYREAAVKADHEAAVQADTERRTRATG